MNKPAPLDGFRCGRNYFKNFYNLYDDKPRCKKKLGIKKQKNQKNNMNTGAFTLCPSTTGGGLN